MATSLYFVATNTLLLDICAYKILSCVDKMLAMATKYQLCPQYANKMFNTNLYPQNTNYGQKILSCVHKMRINSYLWPQNTKLWPHNMLICVHKRLIKYKCMAKNYLFEKTLFYYVKSRTE